MRHEPDLCPHCGAPAAPRILVSHIQATVAAYYQIPVRHMTSDRRDWEVSHPRQVAMYLAAELTPKSYPDLGRLFHRDHTTVIFAERAVQRRMAKDLEVAADICALRERLSTVKEPPHGEGFHADHDREHAVNTQPESIAA